MPIASSAALPLADAVPVHVRLLGELEVEIGGSLLPREAWSYTKPRELFVLLVCHPRGRTREQIGAELWPDATPAQVKNNFHVALHRLRSVLGDRAWVVHEGDRYRLHPRLEVTTDTDHFESAVGSVMRLRGAGETGATLLEALESPLSLYRGDFLESERVGDWHLVRRDRLRRMFLDALQAYGETALALDRIPEARSAFERLIAVDDLYEPAYRGLMRCRAREGDRSGAIRLYQRLESVLDRELHAEPEAETAELAAQLRRGGTT